MRITAKIAECRYSSDQELGATATVAIALPCAVLMGASDIHSTVAQAGLLGCYLALGLTVRSFEVDTVDSDRQRRSHGSS